LGCQIAAYSWHAAKPDQHHGRRRALTSARSLSGATTDASLIDQALAALIARYRSAEIDRSYGAYGDPEAQRVQGRE